MSKRNRYPPTLKEKKNEFDYLKIAKKQSNQLHVKTLQTQNSKLQKSKIYSIRNIYFKTKPSIIGTI